MLHQRSSVQIAIHIRPADELIQGYDIGIAGRRLRGHEAFSSKDRRPSAHDAGQNRRRAAMQSPATTAETYIFSPTAPLSKWKAADGIRQITPRRPPSCGCCWTG